MPKTEIYVCDTGYDNSKWYYYDGWFLRKIGDALIRKISLANFPDPFALWEKRCKIYKDSTSEEYKPHDVTFKLWDYKCQL